MKQIVNLCYVGSNPTAGALSYVLSNLVRFATGQSESANKGKAEKVVYE